MLFLRSQPSRKTVVHAQPVLGLLAAKSFACCCAALVLTACGGGGESGDESLPGKQNTYPIGGAVNGLLGSGLVLQNNGADNLAVNFSGDVSFASALPSGARYSVSVFRNPSNPAQTCNVTNPTGTVGSAAVTSVAVDCTTNSYSVSGTVTGLMGTGLVLRNTHTDNLSNPDSQAVTTNPSGISAFAFTGRVTSGANYTIGIGTQPSNPAQTCVIRNPLVTVTNANVVDIAIECTTNSVGNPPTTFSIGGTVSGLATGTSVSLLNNGGDGITVTTNGPFAFSTPLASGTSYIVTVGASPSGETCTFGGQLSASGQVAAANITSVYLSCQLPRAWTWASGSSMTAAAGVYGGVTPATVTASPNNVPGARRSAVSWTDSLGNLWLFGGFGFDGAANGFGLFNDLWKYNPNSLLWTWVSGSSISGAPNIYGGATPASVTPSPSNTPGARSSAISWIDSTDRLWLFGGQQDEGAGPRNDLWRFDPITALWTWVSGANTSNAFGAYGGTTPETAVASPNNVPGARTLAVSWTDAAGNLWLFGGFGFGASGVNANLNDLWRYSPSTNLWTWVNGSSATNAPGIYGGTTPATVVPSPSNAPGARRSSISWMDTFGNLWLFGGSGVDANGTFGELNDLWRYTPSTNRWTWISGSNTTGARGIYGGATPSTATPSSSNTPGARSRGVSWTRSIRVVTGTGASLRAELWLFGGLGTDSANAVGNLNDLWKFNTSTNLWTWVSGSNLRNDPGSYGSKGNPATTNVPGARTEGVAWRDPAGDLWIFGGLGSSSYLNELWKFTPPCDSAC